MVDINSNKDNLNFSNQKKYEKRNMKEGQIRKLAVEMLTRQGYTVWWPPKVKYRAEGDIFGIGDLIISNKQGIKLIQLTTLSNVSTRRNKIQKILENMELGCPIEIWGLTKDKTFKIVRIY